MDQFRQKLGNRPVLRGDVRRGCQSEGHRADKAILHMEELRPHGFMALGDSRLQILKLVLAGGGVSCFRHKGVNRGLTLLRFSVLKVEAKTIKAKLIFISTRQRRRREAIFQ